VSIPQIHSKPALWPNQRQGGLPTPSTRF
jgi:hypothetical protein